MDIKKLSIGTIAGAIVFFLLGWLVYGNLLADFMRHHSGEKGQIGRTEIKFGYLIAGHVLQALLLTYIFLKSNVSSLAGGLIMGAVVGFLMCAAIDFIMYGTSFIMSKKELAADVLAATLIFAVAGAVIGALTGDSKKS